METTETIHQIDHLTVRAVWTDTSAYPSELHLTTENPGVPGFGITSAVLRDLKLAHPNPPTNKSAISTALDAIHEVWKCQSYQESSVDNDYLKALAAAYRAMSKTETSEPVERMSFFLHYDPGVIGNHLTEARKLGFLEQGEGGGSSPQSQSNSLGGRPTGPLVLDSDMTEREIVTTQKQAEKGSSMRARESIKVRVVEVDNEGNETLLDILVDGECAHDDSLDCRGLKAERDRKYDDWLRAKLSPHQYEDHLRRASLREES
ncbi:hypothetical protein [Streptomyces sp. ATCC 21386]|uniref:hypothetical protein n=1 Tax=Streptomyces sp. ATCC 21386 TaxID=2699428 RepID=UPI001BFF0DB2|nr:hypothetical protein [Streptomyces sp. ATCC 21386]